MNLYEFITPSDPITFWAASDFVACVCATYLGRGQAGVKKVGHESQIPSLFLFTPEDEMEKELAEFLGQPFHEFWAANESDIALAFGSFAYGLPEERQAYDKAFKSVKDDPKARDAFKNDHEKSNRSSVSKWVRNAWRIASVIQSTAKKESAE